MRLSRSTFPEAGLACGFVLTALALAAPDAVALAQSNAAVGRYQIAYQKTIDPRAIAEVPAAPAFLPGWFGSSISPLRKAETDGLSRNLADCVRYGCIDNGGG